MDFEFDAEQIALRDSVRRALGSHLPIPEVRHQYLGAFGTTPAAWKAFADIGLCGLLIDEAHGGVGATMVDAAVVLEELGRSLAPMAYCASSVTVAVLLQELGNADALAQLGPRLSDGSLIASLVAFEPGHRYEWRTAATTATVHPDGTASLDGTKVHGLNASDAELLFVTATTQAGDLGLFSIERSASGVSTVAQDHLDGSRKLASISFDDAVACPVAATSDKLFTSLQRTFDATAVAHAIDAVGAATVALEMCVQYSNERIAFDRPIGSFQAVQHICADMLRAVELGRAAALYACWAHDHATIDEAHRAAMIAAAHCAQAFPNVGAAAIQVFGGIGFTWEHDIQLYYKRLLSAGSISGTAQDFLEELAVIAID